ncbi:MAG: hypothetical protein HYR94_23685, partial [Chloroflexi bacterium]|nr:hypothetical protein [Chloroflexota bacterium]
MLQLHKTQFMLSLCLILLLSMVPVAQAAPPLQGGSTDGATLGDSLNLNEDGTPVDGGDNTSGGNNLGTVMSGKDDETADDGTTADGATEEVTNQHPVAAALSEYFDVDYDEIMDLHEDGYGFGNIARAYFFAD